MRVEECRLAAYSVAWRRDKGLPITYQSSLSKLMTSETWQYVAAVALRTLGPDALLIPAAERAPLRGRIALADVSSLSETIYEGASEIQRNIIAQRGLGLPR